MKSDIEPELRSALPRPVRKREGGINGNAASTAWIFLVVGFVVLSGFRSELEQRWRIWLHGRDAWATVTQVAPFKQGECRLHYSFPDGQTSSEGNWILNQENCIPLQVGAKVRVRVLNGTQGSNERQLLLPPLINTRTELIGSSLGQAIISVFYLFLAWKFVIFPSLMPKVIAEGQATRGQVVSIGTPRKESDNFPICVEWTPLGGGKKRRVTEYINVSQRNRVAPIGQEMTVVYLEKWPLLCAIYALSQYEVAA